jgi:hypothetical protein
MDKQNLFLLIISILILAGIAALWLRKRMRLKRAHSWPAVHGNVVTTSVTLKSGGGQTGSAAYYAEVRYSYAVAGQNYSGALRQRFMLKGRAEKWVDTFATANPLTVRYNPKSANDSVLLIDDLDPHDRS